MPSLKNSVQLLLALLLLIGCDPSRILEVNHDLKESYWHKDSVRKFSFIIPETGEHNIYINLRNSEAYPYHNVFITYFLEDSLENEIESKLVDYNLFNSQTGFPYGKSGIGL